MRLPEKLAAKLVLTRQRHLKWRAFDVLEMILMMLCGLLLFGFSSTVMFDIVTREIGHPWLWLQEVTQTFFIYAIFIGAAVATRIVQFFTGAREEYAAQVFPELTERERDVLGLLASGRRNSEIATALGLSDKTVRNHVSNVLLKLQVPDRTAAALKARESGLGQ